MPANFELGVQAGFDLPGERAFVGVREDYDIEADVVKNLRCAQHLAKVAVLVMRRCLPRPGPGCVIRSTESEADGLEAARADHRGLRRCCRPEELQEQREAAEQDYERSAAHSLTVSEGFENAPAERNLGTLLITTIIDCEFLLRSWYGPRKKPIPIYQ